MMPTIRRVGQSSATKHINLHTMLVAVCITTVAAAMHAGNHGALGCCSLVLCRVPKFLLQRSNDLTTKDHPRDAIYNRPRPGYGLVEAIELDERGHGQL